jgi:rRNA maturation endonuclease Nob1
MLPMVSSVEKQMLQKHLQHCIEEEKETSGISRFHEVHQKAPYGKSIILVQVCHRCGRKFPFKNRRKRCPYCQGLLRTNTMILKVPQF